MPYRLYSVVMGLLCLILPGAVGYPFARADGVAAMMGGIHAFAAAGGGSPVYVATGSGLYRSVAAPFSTWVRQNSTPGIAALSVNPTLARSLVYATGTTLYRSTDGGMSATVVTTVLGISSFARPLSAPGTIYAVASPTYGSGLLLKSTDDGQTWARTYSPQQAAVSSVAVNPTNPSDVLAGITAYHGGGVARSADGGITFSGLGDTGPPLAGVNVVGLNPLKPTQLWAAWSIMGSGQLDHSADGGHTWHRVTSGLPPAAAVTDIAFDPLSGRIYLAVSAGSGQAGNTIWASRDDLPFERFAPAAGGLGAKLLLLGHDGYLLSGDQYHPLTIWKLAGPGVWGVAGPFRVYDQAVNAARLLGRPVGPLTRCAGWPCQYFEKGRLEDHSAVRHDSRWRLVYGAVVGELLAARAALPIGGTTSTVTYGTLHSVTGAAGQVAPPAGFHGGVAVRKDGSAFIPDSPALAVQPGHVVPAYFWSYMSNRAVMPGGWLHDLGLPLTPAIRATVVKGTAGPRTILVQAFQNAILTYDPHNAPAWRVERANAGTDGAIAFPGASR